ncbi:UNVERIFIED_CONTAM: Multicystatin [Sesamum calycinum]|uniref:Cysteine proteinase inhibitor n=1 Tax=Sesamum calycinum TaxID=2727403 RepID=A0AAW2SEC5_9LAMI
MTGAPVPVDITPDIIDLGRFAVQEHNKKENTHLEFKKVYSAKVQVVNGSSYYLTLEAANEGENNFYDAKVYKSWDNNDKGLTEFKSREARPGAIHPIDITPKVNDLARFAFEEHNKKENTLLVFKRVWSAMEQVVEGFMYYLTLEAADGGKNYVYEATVLEKAGKNVKELLEFKLVGYA